MNLKFGKVEPQKTVPGGKNTFSNYNKKAHPRAFKSFQSMPDRGQSGGVGNVGMLKHAKSFVLIMQTSAPVSARARRRTEIEDRGT